MFEELNKAMEALEDQQKMQNRLVGRVAAHINTPLQGGGHIQVAFNIWEDEGELNRILERYLKIKERYEDMIQNDKPRL
ncbi:MAG: hypothetical protein B6U72_02935 [Candidatus Altiarchaeales archaeon ex4484_2]|nr:MAG: hypothetical protein B6U72_02935 [Candidatus Altiarchaeales archaeon ex4484_2]